MGKLDDLLQQTYRASEGVALMRATASESVVNAIRTFERKLREALDGDSLRGLANLAGAPSLGGVRDRFYGAQLSAPNVDLPLVYKAVLCVDKHGSFVMTRALDGDPYWESRPVLDHELRAEWFEQITRSLQVVLERHIARSSRTEANYRATAEFAERLAAAVA